MSCVDQAGSTTSTDHRPSPPSTVPPPTTGDPSGTLVPDAEPAAHEVPDGSWTGPIEAGATGTPTAASGSVYSGGTGTIHVEIRDHAIQSGTATFTATSSGTISTPDGSTGTINGSLTMSDGVVTGTPGHLKVTGSAVESGNIAITVHGININKPLNETRAVRRHPRRDRSELLRGRGHLPARHELQDRRPRAVFSGTLEWHGERDP